MLQPLSSEADVDALMTSPTAVWLFKHSSACGVSSAAHEEIDRFLASHPGQEGGLLVIQQHRPLSNLVSNRLKYVHQSPQLFLLKEGKVLWSATHWSITAEAMAGALAKAQ